MPGEEIRFWQRGKKRKRVEQLKYASFFLLFSFALLAY